MITTNNISKRIDLNLGYSCNQNCKFCYYQKSKYHANVDLNTDDAKKLLRFYKKINMETVEFTGGEPTVRKDLIELANYAKNLRFRSISIITNGFLLADGNYLRKLIEAGIDDFLFSIHGPTPEIHDYLTSLSGSFDKTLQAIKLALNFNVKVRTNTTVTGTNYKYLDTLVGLLINLKIKTINLIFFNPIVEADKSAADIWVNYSSVVSILKNIVERSQKHHTKLTIRYFPLCLLPGYEQYITNMPQIQYDPDEWNYLIRTGVREGTIISSLALALGILLLPGKRKYPFTDWKTTKHEGIIKFLEFKNKTKPSPCKKCSYNLICGGLWKSYNIKMGDKDLAPIPGRRITDPLHFILKNPAIIKIS